MKKIIQFFNDSYMELKKVVWPSREDVASSTKVVIVSTVIIALLLFLFDVAILSGIGFIYG